MTIKEQLLLHLKDNMDAWISGESLSRQLGVSRAAIWKQARNLKEEGYIIQSLPKKGYRLCEISDLLLPGEIRERLGNNLFGGQQIYYYKELDTTNLKAKELASQGVPEGTLIIAEKQTKGRGRRGRSWFSPTGYGIYASMVLRPSIAPTEISSITLMAAVSAAEALIALTPLNFRIKWPNDILLNDKKIAGILTEISSDMDIVDYLIIGIGMNINTPKDVFPPEIKETATSIFIETNRPFQRIEIFSEFLKIYENYYINFEKSGIEPIMERWKELANIVGQRIEVDVMGQKYRGDVVEIENGILILKDHGRTYRIFSGDVTIL